MLLNLERLDLLISQYVAGALPEPAHVLVGSHLQMNPTNRTFASGLEDLAGRELAAIEPRPFDRAQARLQAIFSSPQPARGLVPVARSRASDDHYPPLLHSYAGRDLSSLPWRRKLPGLREHVLEKSRSIEASLIWARPGRALPQHSHKGLELTLVLNGEFHDQRGRFRAGDVSVADETLAHRPVAGLGEPCLCFSVLLAPISLSGSTFRMIRDVLGF